LVILTPVLATYLIHQKIRDFKQGFRQVIGHFIHKDVSDKFAFLKERHSHCFILQSRVDESSSQHKGYLGRNPVDAVERPRVERVEFKILNEDQARQLLTAAIGSPFETIFYLALTTGMRKGELLGLQWSDLDEDKARRVQKPCPTF
jgi:integrase